VITIERAFDRSRADMEVVSSSAAAAILSETFMLHPEKVLMNRFEPRRSHNLVAQL
jgi:hypothetical protein